MRTSLSPAVGLILSLETLIVLARGALVADYMKNFCAGNAPDVRTIPQFLDIAHVLKQTSPPECNDKIKSAVSDLAAIVRDRQVCSMEKAVAITKFVDDHLKGTTGGQSGERAELPAALTKFAIAYGMRVSNVCKNYMMNDFIKFTTNRLNRKFEGQLPRLMDYMLRFSPPSNALLPLYKTAEVVLPSDLMHLVPGMETEVVKFVSDSKDLANLKKVCANTFQPLYEPLLLPLAKLIRAGFNYRGEFSYPKGHKESAQFWYVTTFLCETVKGVEFTSEINEPKKMEQNDEEASKVEANAKPETKAEQERRFFLDLLEENKNANNMWRLVPDAKIGDVIIDERESSLKALVKSFDSNKEDVDRFREMVLDRSLAVFKMVLKKEGKTGLISKKLLRGLKSNSAKELEEVKESLLKLASAPSRNSLLYITGKAAMLPAKTAMSMLSMAFVLSSIESMAGGVSVVKENNLVSDVHRMLKSS